MNSKIAKSLFISGAKHRNPSLWDEYEKLKQSEWLTKKQLHTLQIDKARRFFEFAEKHSPYYNKLFLPSATWYL